jgi:TatD DNase family protein
MELIDTHAHLEDEQFAADLPSVLDRARAAGVATVVAIGTTLHTSRRVVQLARKNPMIRAAVGIHPHSLPSADPGDWDQIVQLATEPEVVAIGETGLDRTRDDCPFPIQLEYLTRHVQLARDQGLPLVIHCREAELDWLGFLSRAGLNAFAGVMHSFTGQAATAEQCIASGFHISFAGQLTYTNRKFDGLREVARAVPLDRLLVETDSPYLAPGPHRGQRNEPAFVELTARRLAELRGMNAGELAAATSRNARALFGLEA